MNISGWAIFWGFIIVFYLVDTYVYLRGHNTFFWKYKTENELKILQKIIEKEK